MGIWLRFLRAPNLLMVALTQYILRHAVLRPALAAASTPIAFDLTEAQFALLVGATVCVTAGGYIVNDIHDQAIDAVNKPQRQVVGRLISERQAWGLYATILGLGLALAVLVALQADYLEWLWLYPASVGALWAYSARLKRTVLWGNVVVSLFTAGVVLLVWLAEQRAFATLAEQFPQAAQRVGVTFMFYAAFSFAGNLLREIVKDLEDVEGDGQHGARTLPVVRGVAWGKRAAFVLLAGLAVLVVAFLVQAGTWGWGAGIVWGVAFLLAPLAVVLVLLIRADGTRDYRRVSTAVKGLMLAGLLYLPFVSTVPLAWWVLPSG